MLRIEKSGIQMKLVIDYIQQTLNTFSISYHIPLIFLSLPHEVTNLS